MKKLFTLLLAVMAVMSVSAQTKLTLGGQSANGNWSWGTTKTMGAAVAINFSSQWGEFKLAAEPGDATGCKLVVAEPNAKVNIVVKFADGSDTQYIGVDATEKDITFPSAASLVELQGTEAGAELEVKSFVLVAADGTETQTTYSEVWGVATYGGIYTSTSQWAQVMLNGAEKDDAQIVKFHCNAPVPAGLQLKVLYTEGGEGYLPLTEGETDPVVTIEKAAKEVSLQFTAADASIDIAYVTTQPVPANYTLNFSVEGADEMCDEWAVQVEDQKLEYPYDNDNPYTFVEGSKVYVGGICTDALHTMVVTVNGEQVENTEGEYGAFLYTFNLTQDTDIKVAFKQNYTLNFSVEGADEMCDEWAVQVEDQKLEYPYDNDNPYTFVEGSKVYVGGICTDALHTMVVTVNGEQVENTEGEYGAFQYSFNLTQDTDIKVAFKQSYALNVSIEDGLIDPNCDNWSVSVNGEPFDTAVEGATALEGSTVTIGGICYDMLHTMVVTVNGKELENVAEPVDLDGVSTPSGAYLFEFTLTEDADVKVAFKDPAPTLVWTKQAAYTNVPESWGEGYGTIYTDDEIKENMLVTVEKWSDNRLVVKNWFNGTDSYYEGYTDVEITYTDDDYYTVSKVSGSACQGNYYEDSDNYFWTGTTNVSGTYVNLNYVYVDPSDESGYVYMYHDPYNYSDYLGWSAYYITWDPAAVSVATGINNVNAADNNAPVYNIAGQRVNNAQKGIFIKNGKKFMVK